GDRLQELFSALSQTLGGDTSGTCNCVSRFLSLAFHVFFENAEADLSGCYQTIILTYYGCIVNPKRSEETARIPHLKEGVLGGADDKSVPDEFRVFTL
ncbi:MAG: hypothetical protein KJ907_14550, partial [Actinobacteria bacterium]|nr:hypothetical protein [Actinomycetota bacterium]